MRSLYVKMDEARFYFPPTICNHLAQIQKTCERYLMHLAQRDQINLDNEEAWSDKARQLTEDQRELRIIYADLPVRFESTLAFQQLISP
jgi:hypothetical protein